MNIDWNSLGFSYRPVKSNIRFHYRDGKWNDGELYTHDRLELSIAANCLHYGQTAFEGMKAFRCKDGKIRVFRPQENSCRMNKTADHLLMPAIPEAMFLNAVQRVVSDNADYVPPYGTGGTLYIRPLLIGTTAQIGINASLEYEFIILVTPVGPYYKGGIKPVDAYVCEDYDRAAPHGTGHIKTAGNYAASLKPSKIAKDHHCPVALFFDAKSHQYIEEFGTSNFIAVTKDGTYVTPQSPSILDSVTNKSLLQIALDLGIKAERRPINRNELASFIEVGACGTAVVITPVQHIFLGDQVFTYGDTIGPVLRKLFDHVTGIQFGELPDTHHWMFEI